MLGSITTIAVIAIGQLVTRPPSSKANGWQLASNDAAIQQSERPQTDRQIMSRGVSTTGTSFALHDSALSRLDWLRSELQSYQYLPAEWDGIGSLPADPEHISAASALLDLLPAGIPLPKPMLSSNGEVGFYWKDERFIADAVIEDTRSFSLFIRFLAEGNREKFLNSIALTDAATTEIKGAFAVV